MTTAELAEMAREDKDLARILGDSWHDETGKVSRAYQGWPGAGENDKPSKFDGRKKKAAESGWEPCEEGKTFAFRLEKAGKLALLFGLIVLIVWVCYQTKDISGRIAVPTMVICSAMAAGSTMKAWMEK